MVVHSNSTLENVSEALVQKISARITQNEPVLFLVSGGSSAPIAVDVCKKLTQRFPSKNDRMRWLLTLSLIDERFGPEGHPDSNWALLESLGLDHRAFMIVPVLGSKTNGSADLENTVKHFDTFLNTAAEKHAAGNMFIAGLLGIGKDGHTAGILADSPAAADSHDSLAIAYKSALFTRITITPAFFQHIDYAAVWAGGEEKKKTLEQLGSDIPPVIHPAQYLKRIAECDIFTDVQQKIDEGL